MAQQRGSLRQAEAEQIVRDLAACDENSDNRFCELCGNHTDHEPTCPWRRAREWVEHG